VAPNPRFGEPKNKPVEEGGPGPYGTERTIKVYTMPPLDPHTPVVLGLDASVSGDCSALVMVSRAPWAPRTEIIVWSCEIWTPAEVGTVILPGNKAALDYSKTLKPSMKKLCRDFAVECIAYDPTQCHYLMTEMMQGGDPDPDWQDFVAERGGAGEREVSGGAAMISDDIGVWCEPFSQQGSRYKSDYGLYCLIRDRQLTHFGPTQLGEHIRHASAKQAKDQDTKLLIIKKPGGKDKIDGAVATSMASYQCLTLNLA
jgi:hypothetical protein